tara:strand:+ start:47 stop:697 length:651 start_codon:yes stop_codon:yes gene_type:complete
MNVKCFLCKKRLFFHWLLNQKLSDDIIEQIIKLLVPDKDYLKEINDEIKIRYRCVKDISNIYEESWHLVNYGPNVNSIDTWRNINKNATDIIKNKSNFYYKQNDLLPFIQNHCSECDCYQCIHKIDYPRHIYLYSKTITKARGDNSRLENEWLFFIYTLLQSIHSKEDINSYGFTTRYDYNNLKKISYDIIKSPLIKDKNTCIQINRIWKKHLLIT